MKFVTAARKEDSKVPFPGFGIAGEEDVYKGKEIIFRIYDVRNKIVRRSADQSKVVSESVYYTIDDLMEKNIPDTAGGTACGRVFPSWTESKKLTEDQQILNRPKTIYGFIWGTVEFPGQEPVVCNFRLPMAEWMRFDGVKNDPRHFNILRNLGYKENWPNMQVKATAKSKNEDKFVEIDWEILKEASPAPNAEAVMAEIQEDIKKHNEYVLDEHKKHVE